MDSRRAQKVAVGNQFDRLPDDVLLLIINKIIDCRTLIQLSLASKRFNSLVPYTDTVEVCLSSSTLTKIMDSGALSLTCNVSTTLKKFGALKDLRIKIQSKTDQEDGFSLKLVVLYDNKLDMCFVFVFRSEAEETDWQSVEHLLLLGSEHQRLQSILISDSEKMNAICLSPEIVAQWTSVVESNNGEDATILVSIALEPEDILSQSFTSVLELRPG
ncbi:hypothetical protein SLEP1_g7516 [Rubroshorea leprosula]|uniref:F-box domain-containing protein n=1 Tax=Rubroshorea leprosula TaxID=152421 RepID=A0AAV5HYQ9_9ROSI|nr:hypothetical protein SLEP1_g7516 [Rubroshorea leprosula]